jgi:hypothetical protein
VRSNLHVECYSYMTWALDNSDIHRAVDTNPEVDTLKKESSVLSTWLLPSQLGFSPQSTLTLKWSFPRELRLIAAQVAYNAAPVETFIMLNK